MKSLYITICALALAVAAHAQRQEINLAGQWRSSLGNCTLPGTTDENKLGGERVASGPTSQLTRLYPYRGSVIYERDIYVPGSMAGMPMQLLIERTKPSTLWIDGDSVGSISQLYAPHVYRLPRLKEGTHHIQLRIDNSDEAVPSGVHGSHAWSDATQTNWNGMLGRIAIESLPPAYIADMQVYPDPDNKLAEVRLSVESEKNTSATIKITLDDNDALSKKVRLNPGINDLRFNIDMGSDLRLWSEFHPHLYSVTAGVKTSRSYDAETVRFGMRRFSTDGTQFTINGKKTFLRGTHDACVFPLTAYAPTDKQEWHRIFSIAKEYGINHFRFHSYTPPEAAFDAADELGLYLMTELPMWGTIDSTTVEQNKFLYNEAVTAIKYLGNHPSFVGLGLGNELWGDTAIMRKWLDDFRALDSRHLYYNGANNDLGFWGPKQGEDLYVTCRVGSGEGFTTHARCSFSFADADHGGILNWLRPETKRDFSNVVALCRKPIVSHESCQYQIYPDYSEIPKYTGVLYPYNLETFRDRLKENNLTHQIDAFHNATGKWAVECYKADMEQCLRTPGFGGYQLLDIKDYPGQGSALVGILDAFMDTKGLVSPDDFKSWNSPVVPLALLPAHCFEYTDTLSFGIAVSNYSEEDYNAPLTWTLGNKHGEVQADVPQGTVTTVANISVPLNDIDESRKIKLRLTTGDFHNRYNVWVYTPLPYIDNYTVMETDTLSADVFKTLHNGGTVLLIPNHADIEGQSIGGLFTPDYWNYSMFKTISENNGCPVSPGSLGLLMNPAHPLFNTFPTDGHSDWQWWSIALNSRPLILDAHKNYSPILQVVDNIERNHKLGILSEFKVGSGRILICTTNLDAISEWPEGRAYADAVRRYAASDFTPDHSLTDDELHALLYSHTKERDIQGVRNITDYKQK